MRKLKKSEEFKKKSGTKEVQTRITRSVIFKPPGCYKIVATKADLDSSSY